MTDILKEKIIIRAIKIYKNREEWTDIYVEQNYSDAIEYMKEYFDKLFPTASGSGAGSTTPDDARIKKIQQGERTIEYEYGNSNSNTTENTKTGLNKRIESDMILSSLLGHPLMRCM